jgi:transposase
MRTVALDLGARGTDFCEVAEGRVVRRGVIKTERQLQEAVGPQTLPARVAFEACREGWHTARLLEGWGHEPVMVDTTRVKQLGIGRHGKKTNRIDAERLAVALAEGRIPQAHILSPHRQQLRLQLSVRRLLVEMRTRCVTAVRGLARAQGVRLPSCESEELSGKVSQLELSPATRQLIGPLVEQLAVLESGIALAEEALERLCAQEPQIRRLTTAPGVGMVVAAGFVCVIDEAGRFRNAHQVESYLGLVPSEDSSGNTRRIGSITKEGNSYLRALLVQGSWCVLRSRSQDPLTLWGKQVARRRGKRIAVVAVARRLTGILWAMWRDETVYDAEQVCRTSAFGLTRRAHEMQFQAEALRMAAKKQFRSKQRLARRTKAER